MTQTIQGTIDVDIQEEVQQVIDLQDRRKQAVRKEIEKYHVTNALSREFQKLIEAIVVKNKQETGMWISGFYGSGKSYLAKVFGYILSNPDLGGTSARKQFLRRAKALEEREFLEQSLGKLQRENFEVIMLDACKQGKGDSGLAWILFTNFLRKLGFLGDKYGLIEFQLFLEGKYEEFTDAVEETEGESWENLKDSMENYTSMRKGLEHAFPSGMGSDVDELWNKYDNERRSFGSEDLKKQLTKYLKKADITRIVFILDEVSRSVKDNIFTLADYEGVQESLSAVGESRVWLAAIAQEKLDEVLNLNNVTKNEVGKIGDRFKTEVHLEGEEVNEVIEQRLLKKSAEGKEVLESFYQENLGELSDLTNLNNHDLDRTQVKDADEFVRLYPFHYYQLELLKNFLFKVHQKAGGENPRGTISVLDHILKRIAGEELYRTATSFELGEAGEAFPDHSIERRFQEANDVVPDELSANGREIMRATYFLNETEKVKPTVEDIIKACISRVQNYFDVKDDYKKP